jgi:hypothetical protein
LRIVTGDGAEQVVELTDTRLQIGRGRDNNIVLPDPQKGVSRVHAELRYENGHYVIVDLQSQNGTWINGRRVDRSELPYGAELAIGDYRLTLLNEQPGPARSAPRAMPPDLLDDIRPTQRYDPPLAAPVPVQSQGMPGWMIGLAVVTVLVVGLAAVVWFTGRGATGPVSDASAAESGAAGSSANGTAAPSPADRTTEAVQPSARKPSAEKASVVTRSSDEPRVTRRPGESSEAWLTRAAALQMRYGYSKAALDRGDFAAAAGGFEAILVEEPGFLDAPRLLIQAQSGLRASARTLYEAGRKLDDAGDWMGALQKYEQARQIQSGIPGLAESAQRVRTKLRAAGAAAFSQARAFEANGQAQDALKEYEKAVQWLATDDPNWHVARAKVQQLKRN